ncbi:hypothetical protein [Planotetraspora phitsanulokensis]|uniref:Uncharacterized protein n=1 Tax=Planotetraspora phitsanulokensis TaxID=575192 RepID=A0A8J3XJ11_9ACTN|nr:hypothetical protein [Planotetraspora phitsanulokensis]GII42934.1 hypothetical protein Pph01_79370 [Planotetraspora phitsanulokensis]
MTYVYKNANTGSELTLDERDACLDMLDNWRIIGGLEDEPAGDSGSEEEQDQGPEQEVDLDLDMGGDQMDRPSTSANKAAWIAYAVSRGMSEEDATALSKAALIEEFGEGDE